MGTKHSVFYSLSENLYTAGSPVVILSGTLGKDRKTGQLQAELVLRNIFGKRILAAVVAVQQRDGMGRPIGGPLKYQYPNLNVERDGEFGRQIPLLITAPETQRFSATVEEVIFEDITSWKTSGGTWEPLGGAMCLEKKDIDPELMKQYKLVFGPRSAYLYREEKDLWYCACGAVNRDGEALCHQCGAEGAVLKNLDWAALRRDKETRLAQEQQEAREKAALEQERRKKSTKRRMIAAGILIPLILAGAGLGAYGAWYMRQQEAYDQAVHLLEQDRYDEAKEAFEALGNFKDSGQQAAGVEDARLADAYALACRYLEEGDYAGALEIFGNLGDYQDAPEQITECRYREGAQLLEQGAYQAALDRFRELGDYKDSAQLVEKIAELNPLLVAEAGDIVTMGSYEQDNNAENSKEPIEWIILAKEENRVLLISRDILEAMPFHNYGYTGETWDNSSVRKWLNGSFLNTAFTDEERESILLSKLENPRNPVYGTSSGKDTEDRMFLLSMAEYEKYFTAAIPAATERTPYAEARRANKATWDLDITGQAWWIRTAASEMDRQTYVFFLEEFGENVLANGEDNFGCTANLGIRPAMWVDMSGLLDEAAAGHEGDPQEENAGKLTGVIDQDLNIRAEPTVRSAVIGTALKGDTVTVFETVFVDDVWWGRIKFEGTDGWIVMNYVTLAEE